MANWAPKLISIRVIDTIELVVFINWSKLAYFRDKNNKRPVEQSTSTIRENLETKKYFGKIFYCGHSGHFGQIGPNIEFSQAKLLSYHK